MLPKEDWPVVVVDELNVAVTDLAAVMDTAQEPVPEQAPDQPAKVEPEDVVAVNVTDVPDVKFAEQVVPQLIPAGELLIVPEPVPDLLSDKE